MLAKQVDDIITNKRTSKSNRFILNAPCSLSYSVRQTAPGTSGYRQRVSVAFGGQLRRPRQHRHRGTKRAGRIVLRSWTLITACS